MRSTGFCGTPGALPLDGVGLAPSRSGARPESGRPVWIFLARGPFRSEGPAPEGWIVLDFLGFSRQNRDFSMGYAA